MNGKHLFFAAALAALTLLASCGGGKTKKTDTQAAQPTEGVYEIDDVLAAGHEHAGKEVTIEGVCSHICKHGGSKIFLMGSDDTKTIRVEAGAKIGGFKPECVNSIVRVTGKLMEQRIDEEYLVRWEEQVKEQTVENHHGDGEEAGCAAEQKAQGGEVVNSVADRIAYFRKSIAERKEKEGREYLSFYWLDADTYEIL